MEISIGTKSHDLWNKEALGEMFGLASTTVCAKEEEGNLVATVRLDKEGFQ